MNNDSFNRSKHSTKPEDVLYNTKAKHSQDHHWNARILAIQVIIIQAADLGEFPSGSGSCTVHFEVKHDPETCMYPHTVVHCFKNGETIAPLKPDQAKRAARDFFAANSKIMPYAPQT